jgi:hypothetical protein
MTDIPLAKDAHVRQYLTPRYVSLPIANLLFFVIVIVNLESVVVEPGQGGTVAVYIWPAYWASYQIQDAMFSLPEYTWSALIVNYVVGFTPLYVATNIGLNIAVPATDKTWRPTLSGYAWGGVFVLLALAHIPIHLFGYIGVVLWLVAAATSLETAVWVAANDRLSS